MRDTASVTDNNGLIHLERGEKARHLSLGAAMAIVIVLLGVSVPLAAMACVKIMNAVDAVMAPPTLAVTSVHPIVFVLLAAAIAAVLIGKERVMRPRAATAVNISAAVVATLIGVSMLVAVILPVIMVGKSIAGE